VRFACAFYGVEKNLFFPKKTTHLGFLALKKNNVLFVFLKRNKILLFKENTKTPF